MHTKTKKIHYGWVVCLLCFFLSFCTVGCINSSFSIYFPFMREFTGISNTQCSVITMTRNLTALVVMTKVDVYLEKMGIRRGIIFGMCLSGLSLVLYGVSRSFAVYEIAAVTAGFAYAFAGLVPVSVIISKWFISKRTFAVGLSVMGTGLATTVLPPIASRVATNFSLPVAFFTVAGIVFALALIMFIFLPENPAAKGLEPINDGASEDKKESLDRIIVGKHTMIFIFISMFLFGIVTYGAVPNMSLLFTSEGLTKVYAASLISIFGLTMTLGKAGYGFAVDKFGIRQATIAAYSIYLVGIIMLLFCGATFGAVIAAVGCILFGPGNAVATVAQPALASHMTDTEHYASTVKKIQLAYTFGSVCTGPFPGMIADFTGSYILVYILFALMIAVSLVFIMLAMMAKKPKETKTD